MRRWQYRVVDVGMFFTGERLVRVLGELGEHGWELVAIYDKSSNWLVGMEKGFALMRREVPDGEEPDGPWGALMFATREPPLFANEDPLRVYDVLTCSRCGSEYRASAGLTVCLDCGEAL
jgi:hypothetical protein